MSSASISSSRAAVSFSLSKESLSVARWTTSRELPLGSLLGQAPHLLLLPGKRRPTAWPWWVEPGRATETDGHPALLLQLLVLLQEELAATLIIFFGSDKDYEHEQAPKADAVVPHGP